MLNLFLCASYEMNIQISKSVFEYLPNSSTLILTMIELVLCTSDDQVSNLAGFVDSFISIFDYK